MGRIAVTEDVEGLRDEEDFGDEPSAEKSDEENGTEEPHEKTESPPPTKNPKGKCIPTVIEVQDAFDSMNTLRYSQPTHLQGEYLKIHYRPSI